MKKLAAVALFLGVGFQLNALALAPNATFGCRKANSEVALMLAVTNNGPDNISKGTKLYYSYLSLKTRTNGTFTTDSEFKKGQTTSFLVSSAVQTPVSSCRVSLQTRATQ